MTQGVSSVRKRILRRYAFIGSCALIIIAGLTVIRLGHSLAQEKHKGNAETGKGLYMDNCNSCHGDKGQGNPKMYKRLGAVIVHLGSKQAQDKSDESIIKTMTDGFGKMEKMDDLKPEDIENIVAFVRTLKQE